MATIPTMDTAPRYTPDTVMTLKGRRPVVSVRAYPPGTHPKQCPLVAMCTAVELVTDAGSRWYGVQSAHINSELRMVISGFDVSGISEDIRLNKALWTLTARMAELVQGKEVSHA